MDTLKWPPASSSRVGFDSQLSTLVFPPQRRINQEQCPRKINTQIQDHQCQTNNGLYKRRVGNRKSTELAFAMMPMVKPNKVMRSEARGRDLGRCRERQASWTIVSLQKRIAQDTSGLTPKIKMDSQDAKSRKREKPQPYQITPRNAMISPSPAHRTNQLIQSSEKQARYTNLSRSSPHPSIKTQNFPTNSPYPVPQTPSARVYSLHRNASHDERADERGALATQLSDSSVGLRPPNSNVSVAFSGDRRAPRQ